MACNIDMIYFWGNIIKMSIGLIIPIIVGIVIQNLVNLNNIFILLLFICVYSIIYGLSMWFLGMNDGEKSLIKKTLRKILKK